MTLRILIAADPGAAATAGLLATRLPGTEPVPLPDSAALVTALEHALATGPGELPDVVLVHEGVGPLPALELVREVALRFPAVGVVLLSADTGPAVYSAAMDAGARGVAALPLTADDLVTRVQAAAAWAAGMRRHLGGPAGPDGPAGTVVTVSGAKGGVGTTVAAVQLALAARSAGVPVALVDLDLQTGDLASYLDVRFRRSVADLAEITDLSPRVLADAMFTHASGLSLLLAPAEGEQGEAVGDRAARAVIGALRSRFAVTVVDCGSHLTGAGAVAVELADTALLLTTPDVVSVRAARRTARMWDRLQVRKPQDIRLVVNRLTRQAELQPPLVERITGAPVARTAVPAAFRELQAVVDSGHLDELDARSTVKQALWALAAEIGVVAPPAPSAAAPAGGPPALPPARRLGRRTPAPGAGTPGGS